MKNRKNIFPIVLLITVIIGSILWGCGYSIMRKNNLRIRNEAILNIVRDYIKEDSNFISQYGDVDTVELYTEEQIVIISDKECQIPCIIKASTGESYLVWIGYNFADNSDVFTYISVDIIADKYN